MWFNWAATSRRCAGLSMLLGWDRFGNGRFSGSASANVHFFDCLQSSFTKTFTHICVLSPHHISHSSSYILAGSQLLMLPDAATEKKITYVLLLCFVDLQFYVIMSSLYCIYAFWHFFWQIKLAIRRSIAHHASTAQLCSITIWSFITSCNRTYKHNLETLDKHQQIQ